MSETPETSERAPAKALRPAVLFDGGCPLCRREIAHYRKLRAAQGVEWVDITATEELESRFGVSAEAAMARFHVRDTEGEWQTGAAGFVELWSHLGPYRWLGRIVTGLRLVPLLEWGYVRWASRRLRARCVDETCAVTAAKQSR
ncbi:MAG: DUF393 domain-containing protein [Pseudomonadota bacterium]